MDVDLDDVFTAAQRAKMAKVAKARKYERRRQAKYKKSVSEMTLDQKFHAIKDKFSLASEVNDSSQKLRS